LTSSSDYSGECRSEDAIIKNKYENGQIYKIEPLHGAHGDIYVGATCGKLQDSLQVDKYNYKRHKNGMNGFITSFHLFDKYGMKIVQLHWLSLSMCPQDMI
jgi:hypothetical protein